jgi:hypothetical protein
VALHIKDFSLIGFQASFWSCGKVIVKPKQVIPERFFAETMISDIETDDN